MKLLTTYSDNAAFEEEKNNLEENNDYAALAIEERDVHVKEIPYMVDIALWDNTNQEVLMIRGWEYDTNVYPTDRYTPIGVEVIPRSHMDDGHARIMSLVYMRHDTPKIGGEHDNLMFGMQNQNIDSLILKNYLPFINESGTTDFGEYQEVKQWGTSDINVKILPSDNYETYKNPFTKQQYYYYNTPNKDNLKINYIPSPYTSIMTKNDIFFTENTNESNPSCLLNFDGKGETAKILNQLAINLGNEDWKTGTTIPSTTSETLGWDKIAPAAQCCWMYCVDEKYKDNPIFGQGQWYLPTVGELCYLIARLKAIFNTLTHINLFDDENVDVILDKLYFLSSSSNRNDRCIYIDSDNGNIDGYYPRMINPLQLSTRSFCLI